MMDHEGWWVTDGGKGEDGMASTSPIVVKESWHFIILISSS